MAFANGKIGLPLPLGTKAAGHKPDVPEARAGSVCCGQVATDQKVATRAKRCLHTCSPEETERVGER